jgi:hypothetical protein
MIDNSLVTGYSQKLLVRLLMIGIATDQLVLMGLLARNTK